MPPHDPDRFRGVDVPRPGFTDDTGEVPAAVAEALAGGDRVAVLEALRGSRLLVPVVAVADEVEVDEQGLAHDKSSDMAAVLLQGRDGRLALLAFTGTGPLAAWDPGARPVPVTARTAAQSALQDGAAALVVDVAGPRTVVVEGEDLAALAAGWVPVRVGDGGGWVAPTGGSTAADSADDV